MDTLLLAAYLSTSIEVDFFGAVLLNTLAPVF
jgi:hypothetical protein